MTRRRASRTTVSARAVLLTIGLGITVLGPGVSEASATSGPYAAFASSTGVHASIANPSFPLGLVIEGPGPNATTSADSIGTSDATASFPYLGAGVQGLPGLAAGLFQAPIPAYPFQASTNAGQDAVDTDGPGFALHAESGSRTTAQAVAGTDAVGARTTSSIDTAGDTIVATADSEISLADVAGLVQVHGIRTHAAVKADPSSGKLTRESSIAIGEITAPGLAITIPESTPSQIPLPVPIPGLPQLPVITVPPIPVPFGGQRIEAPTIGFRDGTFTLVVPGLDNNGYAIDAAPVIAAFKTLGIDLSIEAPHESATGVTSPALVMEYQLPIPPSKQLPSPTTVKLTLGETTASVDLHPAAPAPTPKPPSIASTLPNGSVSATLPSAPAPFAPAAAPSGSASSATVGAPSETPILGAAPIAADETLVYPAIVLAAAGLFFGSQYIRLKGVRSAWGS